MRRLKALASGPVMAEMGLGLGMKKETSSGKGLWEQGAVRVFSAGVEKRGGRLRRGWEPWAGADLGQEPGTWWRGGV